MMPRGMLLVAVFGVVVPVMLVLTLWFRAASDRGFNLVRDRIALVPGIKYALPLVEGQVMVSSAVQATGGLVRGLPEAALKALPSEEFDAILTDINMPGLTGLVISAAGSPSTLGSGTAPPIW